MIKYSDSILVRVTLVLICIFSLGIWSFVPLSNYFHSFTIVAILISVLGVLLYSSARVKLEMKFKNIIIIIIFLRLFSAVPAYLYHGQAIYETLAVERTVLLWVLYFFLHKSKINPKDALRILIYIGVIWAGLTIIQQMTYPLYYAFATREDKYTGEIPYRAGVYRFLIYGLQYGVLAGLVYLTRAYIKRNISYIVPCVFFIIGIYFHSARQFLAGYVVSSLSIVFFINRQSRLRTIAITSIVLVSFFALFDVLFSQYILQSKEDINEDNIRLIALSFFGLEYFPSWLCNIFGNGMPYSKSPYGEEYFNYITDVLRLFREDVGIVGSYNQYGLVYAIVILYSFIKILFLKMSSEVIYLKLFAIFSLSLIVLTEYSYSSYVIPFFCIYFYLIDCYVGEKKLTCDNNPCL